MCRVRRATIWNDAGLTLSIALGVACFPALLIRSATARSSASARSSIAWALLLVAVFCSCAATMAAVAKFALDATASEAGSAALLFDAAPWIADWADKGAGLVTICGQSAKDAVGAIAACGSKTFRPRRPRDQPRHRDARRTRDRRAAAARLDAACGRLPCLRAGRRIAGAVHDRRVAWARPLFPRRRAAGADVAALAGAAPVAAGRGRPCGLCRRRPAGRLSAARAVVVRARRLRPVPGAGACRLVEAGEPLGRACRHDRRLRRRRLCHRGNCLLPPALSSISNRPGWPTSCAVSAAMASWRPRFRSALSWRSSSACVTRRPGVAQRQFAEALARPRDFPVDDERE